MKTRQDIEDLLLLLPRGTQVDFAIFCAEDCVDLIKDKSHKEIAMKAITLTKRWRLGENVTRDDLNAVYAVYAYCAFNAASSACNAASSAAFFIVTVRASYASYAAYCAGVATNKGMDFYYSKLMEMTKSLSALEKTFHYIEDLQ